MGYEKKIQLAVRAGLELGGLRISSSVLEDLNSGLPRTNPASSQSGT